MYVDVKVGKRGEIVIPAFLRKKHNIEPGTKVQLTEESEKLVLKPKNVDVLAIFRKIAKEANIKESDLVYGDKLYEEVF